MAKRKIDIDLEKYMNRPLSTYTELLQTKKGMAKFNMIFRKFTAWARYEYIGKYCDELRADGATYQEAVECAIEETGYKESTVKKDYNKWLKKTSEL